jgi:GxxExxY protein
MPMLLPSTLPPEVEEVGRKVIGCEIAVHRILGPGFKEIIYERATQLELDLAKLKYECEKKIVVRYKQWNIPGHKIDLIVEGCVLVELKAVPRLKDLHERQVISYLKATGLRLGFVINFNVPVLKEGIRRVVV